MAYEISGSIANGELVVTEVQIADASNNSNATNPSISPDGNYVAIPSDRHIGPDESFADFGIEIWHSSSGGWSKQTSIDTDTVAPNSILWVSNTNIWALKRIASTDNRIYSYSSGSSGWTEDWNSSINQNYDKGFMVPNHDFSMLAVFEEYNDITPDTSTGIFFTVYESGSTGLTQRGRGPSEQGSITSLTWVDDDNIIAGRAFTNSDTSRDQGSVRHFRWDGSSYSFIRGFIGDKTGISGDTSQPQRAGSFLYWHTASNSLIHGGLGRDNLLRLNLIPSQSSGYIPTAWALATGIEAIDTSMLDSSLVAGVTNAYGGSISVDRSNGSRLIGSTLILDNDRDGKVYFSLESGSEGWKVNQINSDGNGLGFDQDVANSSQLSAGGSRFVAHRTGSWSADIDAFTIYDFGFSSTPIGPSLIISPTSITLSESGTTASVTVTLSQDPGSVNVVDVSVSIPDSTEVSVDGTLKQLSDSNWNTGVTFTFTGLDDAIDDGDQSFNVTFTTTCSGDTSFDSLTKTLSVTVEDNDTAGFTLGESSLTLVENNSDTISVVLDVQPVSDVVITASLAGSFSGRATISPSQLTFTNSNWDTASSVTVSAVSDSIDNGDVTGDITFSIVTADSSDEYDSVASQTVPLTVEDDDTAGFTISPSSSFTVLEGATRTISVVLNSQPTSDVFVDVSSAATWNSRASMSPSQLHFEVAEWNQAQTISITAGVTTPDNSSETDTVTFSINDSLTSDVKYQALSDQTVDVTVDVPFRVGSGLKLFTSEMGMTATSPMRLNAQPTSDVVVTISGLDTTEGEITPTTSQLTFTTSNWSTDQNIVFTGIQDGILDSNQEYTVTVTAASLDPNYDGTSITLAVINIDSTIPIPDGEPLVPPTVSTTVAGTTKTKSRSAASQADHLPRKIHFEPSTIETIDRSVLSYLTKLNLFADTNEGWKKVPVIWGTAERAYQVKHNKEIRDQQGMLKLPIISVKRASLVKDMPSKGVFQGTQPAMKDEQGGSLAVGRMIYQDKTTKFANADAARLNGQYNYPRLNSKVVYRTVMAPMPVNVTVMYEITIRTEYQQQMNNLMLPFITTPGTINYVRLFDGEHRYEAFIQGDMQSNDNLADFSSDERKFETKIQIKVVGYLVGEENNREKPHYAVRENAVEVKIPRERISLAEVPEMEYGRYYGLEGLPEQRSGQRSPFSTRTSKDPILPYFFSNVPAVGSAVAQSSVDGSSAGGGGGTDIPEGSNLVTTANFAEILGNNMVVRELLKAGESAVPSPANQLTATVATIRANTESVFVNGMIQAIGSDNDYTISGNTITFTYDLEEEDAVYITYIKG